MSDMATKNDELGAPSQEIAGQPPDHDLERKLQEAMKQDTERFEQLRQDAQAAYRAMKGWQRVESEDAWIATCQQAHQNSQSGTFLIERLGAQRYLDPEMAATLLALRRTLLADLGRATTADVMLVDMALLGYYNAFRIQGWIGDLALHIESAFFGQGSLKAKFRAENGRIDGFEVETHVKRLGEGLLPLLDRANKIMLRNLKALDERRRRPMPAVTVGQAAQINVAGQQANAVVERSRPVSEIR
jgi:hypothetical protein